MNKSPYNPPINPESIIDLRPKSSSLALTWRDLTAVKVLFFLIRLLVRLLALIFDIFYKIIRYLGLVLVDTFFGFKNLFINLKYTGAEQGIRLKKFFNFIIGLVLLVPRVIGKLLIRLFSLFKSTTTRVEKGIERESKILTKPKPVKQPALSWRLVNFALLLCLLASPFFLVKGWQKLGPWRNSIIKSTTTAVAGLFSAKDLIEQKNFVGAQNAFLEAGSGFQKAQTDLASINKGVLYLAGLIPDQRFKLTSESDHLLKAGELSASIGAELAEAAKPAENNNVVYFLDRFIKHAIPAADEAKVLASELAKIKISNLPTEYQAKFLELKQQAETLAPSLRQAVDLAEQANNFLGKQIDKRYLLVFQNNSELRASGGFIGSFAVVDFSKGELKNLTVPKGGSYDTEAGLYKRVIAPRPLWLLNPLWHFWDANWWPDWPTTAKKLEWFYEKSNGPTVDGVISLTPTVIENLLKIHGPVDMTKDYGVVITADNFWPVTQTFSEQKPNLTKEPKKIIGDLTSKLLEDLPKNLDLTKTIALIKVLEQSLNEKQILLYFNDPELESSTQQFGWDGSIKKNDYDYLMVVSTNLGGQKSDRAIKQTITHQTEILPDGQIVDNLTIVRQHTAIKNQPFVGVRNVDWLRVYVPANSELISSSGWRLPEEFYFKNPDLSWSADQDLANEEAAKTDPATGTKIYQENGKTVFANWSMVDPGETTTLELKYRLPFKVEVKTEEPQDWLTKIKNYLLPDKGEKYNFLIQKQPGTTGVDFISNLKIDRGWEMLWNYPADLSISNNGWSISKPLDTDLYLTTLFKIKK